MYYSNGKGHFLSLVQCLITILVPFAFPTLVNEFISFASDLDVFGFGDFLWLIYIDGDELGYRLGFGFETQWLHCTIQNISHCMDLDSDPYSLFLCRTGIRIQASTRVRLWQCK